MPIRNCLRPLDLVRTRGEWQSLGTPLNSASENRPLARDRSVRTRKPRSPAEGVKSIPQEKDRQLQSPAAANGRLYRLAAKQPPNSAGRPAPRALLHSLIRCVLTTSVVSVFFGCCRCSAVAVGVL